MAQTCPEPIDDDGAPPPPPGLALPFYVCSGDEFSINIFEVETITSESWSITTAPNENITGQIVPEVGDTVINGTLINTSNVIQIAVYQRTFTIEDCDFIFTQTFFVAVRPENTADLSQDFIVEDDIESGSATDGLSTINLQELDVQFIGFGNVSPGVLSLEPSQFYSSEADALNNTNPLPDEYQNSTPFSEVIYGIYDSFPDNDPINADRNLDNLCTQIVPVTLTVLQNTISNDPQNLVVCDDDTDGFALFDLTQNDVIVLGTQNPTNFAITYHLSQADADNNINSLANPASFFSASATIYVRVEDVNSGAFETASFELVVNPIPTPIQPALFALCDDIESGSDIDEFSIFDLRSRDDEITGGNDDWTVSYHLTQAASAAATPTLPDMYQNVTFAEQTIWVRVEDVVTGCFELITLSLSVIPLPSPSTIPAVEECDENGDGIAIFDLTTDVTTNIINGESFTALTFHETPEAAEIGTPFIVNTENYQTVSRTLWVRSTDTDPATTTECFRTIEIELLVLDNPVLSQSTPFNYVLCEEFDGDDSEGIVDLTVLADSAMFLSPPQTTAEFNFSYYNSLIDAQNDISPLATPLAVIDDEEIFFRVDNLTTGCVSINSVVFTVETSPTVTTPDDFEACDGDNDGFTSFFLAQLDNVITNGEPNVTVFYFETEGNAVSGNIGSSIDSSLPFNNIIPFFQTIYARVFNTSSGCFVVLPINLVAIDCTDTDDDGIIDTDEDLNGNGDLEDDDTDDDGTPNYQDDDDDGDTVLTSDEITGIGAGFTQEEFIDTDGDLIENYLDDDDDGDTILTVNEDYNDSGSPLDDDLNTNGIPDFLDAAVALSVGDAVFNQLQLFYIPENEQLSITGINEEAQITIYNLNGQKQIVTALNTTQGVSLDGLSKGVYLVQIEANNGSISTTKFVKY